MRRLSLSIAFFCASVLLVPATVSAQASISGLVQDASGGVLPGVTVEVASPVLIEKVRTATTDGAGLYRVTDLRPGTYTVTFTLTGFSTVKREGIVLTGNFDAQVNGDMRVGAIEETIVVSGASPIVDTQSTLTQTVLTKEQIEVLPGARTIQGRAALVPGVMVTSANTGVIAHGSASTDSHTMVDGYKAGMHLVGRGTGRLGVGSVTQTQEATIEELVYDAAGQGAEYAFSGVRMNMIPKEGSNTTHIETIAYGSRENFEWNNLGDLQNAPYNFITSDLRRRSSSSTTTRSSVGPFAKTSCGTSARSAATAATRGFSTRTSSPTAPRHLRNAATVRLTICVRPTPGPC